MKYTKPSAGRRTCNIFDEVKVSGGIDSPEYIPSELGRFPSNFIFSDGILCGEDYEQYFYNVDNVKLKNNVYEVRVKVKLMLGDCLEQMKRIPDNYVDSIITDPPAGISFMGKEWDDDKGGRNNWIKWMKDVMVEAKRTLKPGGHCFVWALPRTSHWTATALEDAGFEIRDVVHHTFGSGFPKSRNVWKNDLQPLVEAALKEQGIKNIEWKNE